MSSMPMDKRTNDSGMPATCEAMVEWSGRAHWHSRQTHHVLEQLCSCSMAHLLLFPGRLGIGCIIRWRGLACRLNAASSSVRLAAAA